MRQPSITRIISTPKREENKATGNSSDTPFFKDYPAYDRHKFVSHTKWWEMRQSRTTGVLEGINLDPRLKLERKRAYGRYGLKSNY